MGIEKHGPTGNAISLMRGEMKRRAGQVAITQSIEIDESNVANAISGRNLEDLKTELSQLVSAVDVADQSAVNAAKPKIIRAILLWEFGQSLRDHPEWHVLLERIQVALETDPSHQSHFKKIIQEIKRIN